MRNRCFGSLVLLLLTTAAACGETGATEAESPDGAPPTTSETGDGGARTDAATPGDASEPEPGEWTMVPQKVASSDALSVWGGSPNDLWVGLAGGTFGMLEAMRWDGTAFTAKNLGSATGAGVTIAVRGISGTAGSDLWLVGGTSRGSELGKAYHFNGSTFDSTLDHPTGNGYTAVFARAKNDVWAADRTFGQTAVGAPMHFDGTTWTRSAGASAFGPTEVLTLWGAAANDVWAGSLEGFAHWNGTTWARTDTDAAGKLISASVHGIFGFSPSDVWAITNESEMLKSKGGALRHYDGKAWSAPTSLPTGQLMRGLWGSSSSDLWAVGTSTMHYDGKAWSAVPSPLPGGGLLNAVWGFGPSDVWAVGNRGVVLHYAKKS